MRLGLQLSTPPTLEALPRHPDNGSAATSAHVPAVVGRGDTSFDERRGVKGSPLP